VVLAHLPYLYSSWLGRTRPHIFTWIIWTTLTAIAAAAQHSSGAGPGAWATMLSAFFCFLAILFSLKHGELSITRNDKITFACSMAAIPLWYFTSNPLLAIVLATAIDASAYVPTLRKSYYKPKEELVFHYVISNTKHIASILAMSIYSVATLLYPCVLFFMNMLLITILLWRRRKVTSAQSL
jgi:hypothetical protein